MSTATITAGSVSFLLPLKDRVMGLLSYMARLGTTRISNSDFYKLMLVAQQKFPDYFFDVVFVGKLTNPYDKRLDTALQEWICYGVDIVIGNEGCCLLEVTSERAEHYISHLREHYPQLDLSKLEQVAQELVAQLSS